MGCGVWWGRGRALRGGAQRAVSGMGVGLKEEGRGQGGGVHQGFRELRGASTVAVEVRGEGKGAKGGVYLSGMGQRTSVGVVGGELGKGLRAGPLGRGCTPGPDTVLSTVGETPGA